jgi:hypothetical protein
VEAAPALIERLHAAPPRAAFAITGGGASALAALLAVPGASRTVLEAVVPYHPNALADYLGRVPDRACSADTGRLLAERAFERARRLVPGEPVFGLGLTAALPTDRARRGDERVFLSVACASGRDDFAVTFAKGARDRAGGEAAVAALALNAVARAKGVYHRLPTGLTADESLHHESVTAAGPLTEFLAGTRETVGQAPDGGWLTDVPAGLAVLPGSFNPLHDAHRQLAEVAARRLNRPVAFELSVRNVDKPDLGVAAVRQRLAQFLGRAPLWLTRAPTFDRKAGLFPGAVFVVGLDTALRLLDPRYWGGTVERRDAALGRIRDRGCRFLVAGRVTANGVFAALDTAALPEEFADLFDVLSEAEFRLDLSSSQLRAALGL